MDAYRLVLIAIVCLGHPAISHGEQSLPDSDAQVIERISGQKLYKGEDGKLQIARSTHLRGIKNAIVGFTEFHSDPTDKPAFDIQLNIIDADSAQSLSAKMPDACEVEGGSPILRSFFFVNADKESDVEIGVICGWKEHPEAECPQYDQARFFKILNKPGSSLQISKIEDGFANSLYHTEKSQSVPSLNCDGAPNFKSANDIKRILTKKAAK